MKSDGLTVHRIVDGKMSGLPIEPAGGAFRITLPDVRLAEMLLITANPGHADRVRERLEQLRPALEKVLADPP